MRAGHDLRTLLAGAAVTVVEALPQAHYEAEHLPAERAARLVPDRTRTVVTRRGQRLLGVSGL